MAIIAHESNVCLPEPLPDFCPRCGKRLIQFGGQIPEEGVTVEGRECLCCHFFVEVEF